MEQLSSDVLFQHMDRGFIDSKYGVDAYSVEVVAIGPQDLGVFACGASVEVAVRLSDEHGGVTIAAGFETPEQFKESKEKISRMRDVFNRLLHSMDEAAKEVRPLWLAGR